jgi:hypothetical protein
MKKSHFLIVSFFLLVVVFTKVDAQQNNPPFKLSETGYGIYTSHTVEKESIDGSASIDHAVVEKQVLVKKTEKVPAKLGIQFGTVYKLTGKDKDTASLEIEWIFPHEIMDTAKNAKYLNIRYPIKLPINFVNSSCYTLDNNFEVVKGIWIVNIYSDNKIIFTRKFDLY